MTQKRVDQLNRMAIILYRKERGDTVSSIAQHFHVTNSRIHQLLDKSRSNARVMASAELMRQSSEMQLAFDFDYPAIYNGHYRARL